MVTPTRLLHVIVYCIVPLLLSCEFELTERYEPLRDEDRPPPEIQVHEMSFQEDTIFAYSDQLLTYRFSTLGGEEILGVRILLDHTLYEEIDGSSGSVGFSHEFLSKGPHQVDLEIYTTSSTGSISDQLNAEQYVFRTGRVLYMVKDYINLEVREEDGILRLEWEEYLGSDFVDYGIEKFYNQVFRVNSNSYNALGHIGQRAEYKIWAMTRSNNNFQMGNQSLAAEYPQIKRSMTDSASYYIHWDKPKYYGALEKIQLWEDIVFGDPPTHTLVKETSDFNDTIFHVRNIAHGQLRSYQLILFGKYPRDPLHEEPVTAGVNASYTYYTQ